MAAVSPTAPAAVTGGPAPNPRQTPLPRWIERAYEILPLVLYAPDALFNYYVYSDGAWTATGNGVLAGLQIALWASLSVGVVSIAYFLSVLAPHHWVRNRYLQALCCFVGVAFATAVTIWNSFSYRSSHFVAFKSDAWAQAFLNLPAGMSTTMILVSIAPPLWGLFWAFVQPTGAVSTSELRVSHQERLLRAQQEAELKAIKAQANAQVRAAQLQGMGAVAKVGRAQLGQVLARAKDDESRASAPAPTSEEGPSQLAEPTPFDRRNRPNTRTGSPSSTPTSTADSVSFPLHGGKRDTNAEIPVVRPHMQGHTEPRSIPDETDPEMQREIDEDRATTKFTSGKAASKQRDRNVRSVKQMSQAVAAGGRR